jgi:hypothetical protein
MACRENVFPWRTKHSNTSIVFDIHVSLYFSLMKICNCGKEIFAPSYKEYACVQKRKISLKTRDLIPCNCRKQSPSHEPHPLPAVPTPFYPLADMSEGSGAAGGGG